LPFIKFFAVATAEEGKQLRESGVKKDILILGGILEDELECFNKYSLIPVISDFNGLNLLKYLKNKIIHIKFDTGMHRLGFYKEDINKILMTVKEKNIKIEGVMSHFPSADTDKEFTEKQIKDFKEVVKNFDNLKYIHIQNSAGLVYKCDFCNLVRIGLAIYGEKPFDNFPVNIENCMYVKAKLIAIKNIKKGDKVSYCGTFKADREMKIGVVSFGYADGLPRDLSNKGYVLINGKKAYIIGNITMDMTIVNLENIDAKIGDEVIIIGKQKDSEITFTEVAKISNTIPYEIMCGISKRVKRIKK
jgi:alanine racemase